MSEMPSADFKSACGLFCIRIQKHLIVILKCECCSVEMLNEMLNVVGTCMWQMNLTQSCGCHATMQSTRMWRGLVTAAEMTPFQPADKQGGSGTEE